MHELKKVATNARIKDELFVPNSYIRGKQNAWQTKSVATKKLTTIEKM